MIAIRRRVFTLYGESIEGLQGFIGKTCDRFQKAYGNTATEKADEACTGCMKCFDVKKGIDFALVERVMNAEKEPDNEDNLADEIERIVGLELCGVKQNWNGQIA